MGKTIFACVWFFSITLTACSAALKAESPTLNPTLANLNTAAVQTIAVRILQMTLIPKTQPPPALQGSTEPLQSSTKITLSPTLQDLIEPTQTNSPPPTSNIPCNRADFLGDVTIPDGTTLPPGFTFTKTWRIRNSGSCNWSTAYHIIYVQGTPLGSTGDFVLQSEVPPGAEAQISLPLQAPMGSGFSETHWKMRSPDGQVFGVGENGDEPLWVKITVEDVRRETQIQPENTSIASTEIALKCSPQGDPSFERKLFSLINVERTKKSQFMLISSPQLTEAARSHSRDMAIYSYTSHTNSDGDDLPERMKKQNLSSVVFSENLYHSQGEDLTTQRVIDKWMNNDTEQANVINDIFSRVGIGYMFCNTNPKEYYVTAIFAQSN